MPPLRARIFIDYWNFQLSINKHGGNEYWLDWKALSPCLITEAESLLGASLQFEGTNVYLSYNPKSPGDRKLRFWSTNTLDRFPGIKVISKERKIKRPPTCPRCHQKIDNCPHCGNRMIRTVEKGIDTAIVTDMISLAWEEAWDIAMLVTSDRDYIPAVEFLANKGQQVINVYFPPKGADLARTCWASIDIRPLLPNLAR